MPNWTSSTTQLTGSGALASEFLVRVPGVALDGSQDTIAQVSGTDLIAASVGSAVQAYNPLLTNFASAANGYVFVTGNTVVSSTTIPASAISGNIAGTLISGNISGNANNITSALSSNQVTIGLGFTPSAIDLSNVIWGNVSNTVLTSMFVAMRTAGLFNGFLGA